MTPVPAVDWRRRNTAKVDVAALQAARREGTSLRELGKEHGISYQTVSNLCGEVKPKSPVKRKPGVKSGAPRFGWAASRLKCICGKCRACGQREKYRETHNLVVDPESMGCAVEEGEQKGMLRFSQWSQKRLLELRQRWQLITCKPGIGCEDSEDSEASRSCFEAVEVVQ